MRVDVYIWAELESCVSGATCVLVCDRVSFAASGFVVVDWCELNVH